MGFEGMGEGKKTKMVTPFRNMVRPYSLWGTSLAARWLVHSLAHELAASPEATSRPLVLGALRPGRGEWPSGQKRQTVNLLKFFYVGSNPASPTCLL